jgi:Thioredoxin-like
MKLVTVAVASLVLSGVSFAQTLPKFYDAKRVPQNDLSLAIKLANKMKHNIIINVGGDWCGDSRRLDAFLKENPDIYSKINSNYVFFKIYIGRENSNSRFFSQFPDISWVPSFILLSPQGEFLRIVDTRDLSTGVLFDREKFDSLIESNLNKQ